MLLVPVEPRLNDEHQLVSLLEFAGNEPTRAWVKPLPTTLKESDKDLEDRVFTASIRTASKLKIAGAFELSSDMLHEIGVWDLRYGVLDLYGPGDVAPNSLIRGAFWGSSMRITLKTSAGGLDSGMALSAVAASAQLNASMVEYELSLVGDVANSLTFFAEALDGLPITGTFDYEAYAHFKCRLEYLRKLFVKLAPARPTSVIAVDLTFPLEPTWLRQTASTHYAMSRILEGMTLVEALAHAPSTVAESVVADTYKRLANVKDVPAESDKEVARGWLNA